MKFDTKCIKCKSQDDIDTVLTVKIDDVKYDVAICSVHSEDITPKQVKQLVQEKIDEYNELVARMKEFDIDVPKDDDRAIVVATTTKPEPVQEEIKSVKAEPKKIVLADADGKVYAEKAQGDTARIKKNRKLPPIKSVGGTAHGMVASQRLEMRQSLDPTTQTLNAVEAAKRKGLVKEGQEVVVPVTEDVEYQVVNGRGGKPMTIPKTIRHNNGSTNVAIVNTGGDRTIQERFKEMAEVSKREDGNFHVYGRDGYDTEPCNMCDGTGINRVTKGECPKCNGVGFLNRGLVR